MILDLEIEISVARVGHSSSVYTEVTCGVDLPIHCNNVLPPMFAIPGLEKSVALNYEHL